MTASLILRKAAATAAIAALTFAAPVSAQDVDETASMAAIGDVAPAGLSDAANALGSAPIAPVLVRAPLQSDFSLPAGAEVEVDTNHGPTLTFGVAGASDESESYGLSTIEPSFEQPEAITFDLSATDFEFSREPITKERGFEFEQAYVGGSAPAHENANVDGEREIVGRLPSITRRF